MIYAPYNFVPLSKEVFFPDWVDEISQDVPFRDGVSGTITLKITAKSPIFIRNGYAQGEKDNTFSHTPDGRYFIPGTSIKGCIRNVLEIISFGKMSRVSDKRYGIRDLKLKKYLNAFQYEKIHCGWMTIKGNTITIEDHGIPRSISHKELDKQFKTTFCNDFSAANFEPKSDHSSLSKYEKLNKKLKAKFNGKPLNELEFRFNESKLNRKNKADKRMEVKFHENGVKRGTIVLTGQSTGRKNKKGNQKASGKFYEFVFLSKKVKTFSFDVEDDLYQDFCFIYQDSDEWKYWKEELERGKKVPIFFYIDGEKMSHMGLSYLYKLPYPKKVNEYLPKNHRSSCKDLCECIFGMTDNENSLRGRVQFSHAFKKEGDLDSEVYKPYLSSPKPTYYPIYLPQKGKNGRIADDYNTMFNDVNLKGWKRYPIRKRWITEFPEVPEKQKDNLSPFNPFKAGSVFECKVRFFNLKKVELGALLCALDLGEGCYHTLGLAKPFGYGQVSIRVTELVGCATKTEDLKKAFEEMMSQQIPGYKGSVQLKELRNMLKEQSLRTSLNYMDLSEFVDCKKQNEKKSIYGEYLQNYSEYIKKKVPQVKEENLIANATVTVYSSIKQAKIEGMPKSVTLDLGGKKERLKVGDKIQVKKVLNRGTSKIEKLIFIKKL